MDTSEATTIVMSRIQSLDRENASKIMGYILIQDQGEKEIIRLAFSPDTLLLSYINQAKLHLGLSSSPPPFPLNPSPPILIPNNGAFPFRPRPVSYPDDPILSPTDPLLFPYAEDAPSFHDEPNHGFLWRPCMYYARGFCKNGSSCRFLHLDADPIDVSDQVLKLKQRSEFSSSSRQIYLTFPADSMFNEEDVSNYFSMFGQVQDVRIPYQQRRMFGFVTFVHPETVKAILDKGNPHFVCESRVLVKPYKEKGKIREKKQHLERGDYSACLSPLAIDSMEHYDRPYGPRMLLSPQEMMLREKLEREAELLNAIEFQGQRMMSLQLRNQNHNHQYLQTFPFSSPRSSRFLMDQNGTTSFPSINVEDSEESDGGRETAVMADEKLMLEGVESTSHLHGRLEHVLPDNLFAFPSKPGAKNESVFNRASVENAFSNNTPTLPHPNTSL